MSRSIRRYRYRRACELERAYCSVVEPVTWGQKFRTGGISTAAAGLAYSVFIRLIGVGWSTGTWVGLVLVETVVMVACSVAAIRETWVGDDARVRRFVVGCILGAAGWTVLVLVALWVAGVSVAFFIVLVLLPVAILVAGLAGAFREPREQEPASTVAGRGG